MSQTCFLYFDLVGSASSSEVSEYSLSVSSCMSEAEEDMDVSSLGLDIFFSSLALS